MLPPNPTTAPRGGGVWREDLSLERIAALLGAAKPPGSATLLGDDAAVLAAGVGERLLCVDAGVVGVHLDAACFPIGDLGYRTAIATLSDVAAMGGVPRAAVVSILAPGDVDVVEVERCVISACATVGCEVVGGDLSTSSATTVVVAVLGEATARTVPRAGATRGDAVMVTGPLGASALGLRRRREGVALDDPAVLAHRMPVARVTEGEVAASCGATSMIDVSDGLARDVRRLAAASHVGVELRGVPVAPGATLDDALGGGEDYELVFTHPAPEVAVAAFAAAGLRAPVVVGAVTGTDGVLLLDGAALADVGWRHGAA